VVVAETMAERASCRGLPGKPAGYLLNQLVNVRDKANPRPGRSRAHMYADRGTTAGRRCPRSM